MGFIATAAILFTINPRSELGIIFSGLGLLALVILVIILLAKGSAVKSISVEGTAGLTEEQRRRAEELYKQRVDEALQVALGKKNSISIDARILAIKYEKEIIKEEICMVCKLQLKNAKDVLQCPRCESLYHRNHLEKWIKSKKSCPVCSQKLYEEITQSD